MQTPWLWLVLGAVACNGDPAAVFGHALVPPPPLDQLRPGMSLDEVKRLVPDLENDPGHGWLVARPTKRVKLYMIDDGGRVAHTYAVIDGIDGKEILTSVWGPPDAEPDVDHSYMSAWRSVTTGWRAGLFCGDGKGTIDPFCTVEFRPYRPVADAFARPITPPPPFANARWGMSRDELAAATGPDGTLRELPFEGVRANPEFGHDRLWKLSFHVPPKARNAALERWGQPLTTTGDQLAWVDPSSGWRARLRGEWLELVSTISPPQMLDLLDTLRGKSAAELRDSRPDLYFDDKTLWLPPLNVFAPDRVATDVTFASVSGSGGVEVLIRRDALRPGGLEAILAALDAKWGRPKVMTKGRSITREYGGHAVQHDNDDYVSVGVD